jgi:predicted transposase YbfD/YdcC
LILTRAGAAFFLALKENQPTLYALAQQKLDHLPPAWTSDTECAHGRIEYRELRVAAFDPDVSLFPGARQLASLTRYYQQKCGGDAKQETRHFILSLEEGEASLVRLAAIGREHWSVENKNHWRRDATRWREDRSARRKPKGAKNLALLRGAILALIPLEKFSSLNAAFDHYTENRSEALHLLTQTPPHCP